MALFPYKAREGKSQMSKVSRNEGCKCGSGKKYKMCCLRNDEKSKGISVFSEFSSVPDPRDNRGKRYKLIDLLVMVIYGITES